MSRALLLALLFALPARVSAQECNAAEAQAQFGAGVEHAARRELTAARDAYQRSLELCPRVPTAYNLAVVLRLLGSPLGSRALLDGILERRYGEVPEAQASVIAELREEVRREVAVLRVVAVGASELVLTVDGREVAPLREGVAHPVEVDPGRRLVEVTAPDGRSAEIARDLSPGAELSVRLELPLGRANGRLIVTAPSGDDEIEIVGVARGRGRLLRSLPPDEYVVRMVGGPPESIELAPGQTRHVALEAAAGVLRSPWFWVVAGLVVAAGVSTGVGLALRDQQSVVNDPIWGRVEILRAR